MKVAVRVVAALDEQAAELRAAGFNPCVEVVLGERRCVWDVAFHLYGKWRRPLALQDPAAAALPIDASVRWLRAAYGGFGSDGVAVVNLTYTLLDVRVDYAIVETAEPRRRKPAEAGGGGAGGVRADTGADGDAGAVRLDGAAASIPLHPPAVELEQPPSHADADADADAGAGGESGGPAVGAAAEYHAIALPALDPPGDGAACGTDGSRGGVVGRKRTYPAAAATTLVLGAFGADKRVPKRPRAAAPESPRIHLADWLGGGEGRGPGGGVSGGVSLSGLQLSLPLFEADPGFDGAAPAAAAAGGVPAGEVSLDLGRSRDSALPGGFGASQEEQEDEEAEARLEALRRMHTGAPLDSPALGQLSLGLGSGYFPALSPSLLGGMSGPVPSPLIGGGASPTGAVRGSVASSGSGPSSRGSDLCGAPSDNAMDSFAMRDVVDSAGAARVGGGGGGGGEGCGADPLSSRLLLDGNSSFTLSNILPALSRSRPLLFPDLGSRSGVLDLDKSTSLPRV
jgi:hypothetical protein